MDAQEIVDDLRKDMEPESIQVEVHVGEIVKMGITPVKVLNTTEKSVTVRPLKPLLTSFKGLPVRITKVLPNKDVVLKIATPKELEEYA